MENNKGRKNYKVGYDKSIYNKKKKSPQVNKVTRVNKDKLKNLDKFKFYDNSSSVNLEGYEDFDKFNFIENTSVLDLSELINEDNVGDYVEEPILISLEGDAIMNAENEVLNEFEENLDVAIVDDNNLNVSSVDVMEELTENLEIDSSDVVSVNDVEVIEEDEITEVLDLEEIKYQDTADSSSEIPEMIVENTEPVMTPIVEQEPVNTIVETPVAENVIVNNDSLTNVPVQNNISVSYDKNNKAVNLKGSHFGFIKRVILLSVISIFAFVVTIVLGYLAFNYSEVEDILYSENGSVTYSVCFNDNDYYKGKCQASGMQYVSSLTNSIDTTLNYSFEYLNKSLDYKFDYYVEGKTIIYDRDDASKILYKNNENLTKVESVEGSGSRVFISSKVNVDFRGKNDFVNGYKSTYALNSLAKYDVCLYVNTGTGFKEVASISVPLSMQTFGISEDTVLNTNQKISLKKITNTNYIFGGVAILFGLAGAVVLFNLFKLIYRTVDGDASLYQKKLNQILTEYDRVIVISRSEYEINPNKQFIKLDSFFELLDARDTLEKPIIYEKVNSVKSFFYVEDDDRIYRYTMKESDFEKK